MKKVYICPSLSAITLHTEHALLGLSGGNDLPVNGGYGEEQLADERDFEEYAIEQD